MTRLKGTTMYNPIHYREERPDVLAGAIRDIKFAVLVTPAPDGIKVTHLPLILKGEGDTLWLEGHVARPNDHWGALEAGAPSVAIFQGPHAYVSPSFYEAKREHGKVVPTWNYVTVHAHGTLNRVDDPAALLAHLNDLTDANETGRHEPWSVSDAPDTYVAQMMRAIVGLRLKVERLEGKWKMSQNRPAADRLGTIAGLAGSAKAGDLEVAETMRVIEAAKA
jgi:transcriptional regulator